MRNPYKRNNGWKWDIDVYNFGNSVCFRIWRTDNYFGNDVGLFSQPTLGM